MEEYIMYRWKQRNEKPSIRGNHYPTSSTLPSEATVRENGKSRIIRCVQGASSIYQEDQIEAAGGVEYRPDGRPYWRKIPIRFNRGLLKVSKDNKIVVDYLDALEKSSGYAPFFERIRPEVEIAQQQATFDVSEAALERYVSVKNSLEEMTSFLRAIGTQGVERMSDDDIRFRVRREAHNNPKRFLEVMNAPERKVLAVVNKAIERGLIVNEKRSWFDTGGDVNEKVVGFQIGAGDPTELFVNWLETEGKEYYKSLSKRVEG
jgi:hypothetical protein